MTNATNNIIRQCREFAGLTQVALAARLDMQQQVISRLESDKHSIAVPVLMRVADACEVTITFDGEWQVVATR